MCMCAFHVESETTDREGSIAGVWSCVCLCVGEGRMCGRTRVPMCFTSPRLAFRPFSLSFRCAEARVWVCAVKEEAGYGGGGVQ